jgi:hypothetical protein
MNKRPQFHGYFCVTAYGSNAACGVVPRLPQSVRSVELSRESRLASESGQNLLEGLVVTD